MKEDELRKMHRYRIKDNYVIFDIKVGGDQRVRLMSSLLRCLRTDSTDSISTPGKGGHSHSETRIENNSLNSIFTVSDGRTRCCMFANT